VSDIQNIMLVGVGGQGIILASEVLSEALLLSGHDVKKSEIHGMAQRGGSVRTDVRFGARVWSPLIPAGGADILVAFEQLESLRYLAQLRPGGQVLLSTEVIIPTTAIGGPPYPAHVEDLLRTRASQVWALDSLALATQAGNPRTAGTCLLGALSHLLPVAEEHWQGAFKAKMPPRFLDVNWQAFHLGKHACA